MAAGDGLISMKPTSIAHSGTSASINSDGGVDFSAVTSLSLNGVFTGDYDNYLIVFTGLASSGAVGVNFRLRASGTDASGTDYTQQLLRADSTTVSAARVTSATQFSIQTTGPDLNNGSHVYVYGPHLAQPTAVRSVTEVSIDASLTTNVNIFDRAQTHSLSTSYDGFTIETNVNNITGTIHVFGYEE
jgi:hypothetical protein